MIDMKLGQSTNPIIKIYTTELHVCKQQHMPTANKKSFACFSQYLKHPSRYVYETLQTPRI